VLGLAQTLDTEDISPSLGQDPYRSSIVDDRWDSSRVIDVPGRPGPAQELGNGRVEQLGGPGPDLG